MRIIRGKAELTVELVIIETPVIQRGEFLLEEIEDLGVGGIEGRRPVIQDDLSVSCPADTSRDAPLRLPHKRWGRSISRRASLWT